MPGVTPPTDVSGAQNQQIVADLVAAGFADVRIDTHPAGHKTLAVVTATKVTLASAAQQARG